MVSIFSGAARVFAGRFCPWGPASAGDHRCRSRFVGMVKTLQRQCRDMGVVQILLSLCYVLVIVIFKKQSIVLATRNEGIEICNLNLWIWSKVG